MSMVFGNLGPTSATGVAFTRDPGTGERIFFGEYLVQAQGEDVVAGLHLFSSYMFCFGIVSSRPSFLWYFSCFFLFTCSFVNFANRFRSSLKPLKSCINLFCPQSILPFFQKKFFLLLTLKGIRTPQPITIESKLRTMSNLPAMEEVFPEVFLELMKYQQVLETHFRDMQVSLIRSSRSSFASPNDRLFFYERNLVFPFSCIPSCRSILISVRLLRCCRI